MNSEILKQLATGQSCESIPKPSVSDVIEAVLSSSMTNVEKLSAVCAVRRITLRGMHEMIVSLCMRDISIPLPTLIDKDELIVKGGGLSKDDSLALGRTAMALMAMADRITGTEKDAYILGRINPSICDIMEAFYRVFQMNYVNSRALSCFLTDRNEMLMVLAVLVETVGFSIVTNIREKGRTIAKAEKIAADTINSDTTLDNPKD